MIERLLVDIADVRVEVIRKDIRNLHIGVYPPVGRVRVAAPLRMDDEAVRLAVISRLGWIRRRQAPFRDQDRQSERGYVTGESHYVEGRRYRLRVVEAEGPPLVRVVNRTTVELRVRPGTDRKAREAAVQTWYRRSLREQITPLLGIWAERVGVDVPWLGIRRMRTRWGTANADTERIWLNAELAKKPASCVEYVLVHELVHLLERRHDARFEARMDAAMPMWRSRRDELRRAPLAHEAWPY